MDNKMIIDEIVEVKNAMRKQGVAATRIKMSEGFYRRLKTEVENMFEMREVDATAGSQIDGLRIELFPGDSNKFVLLGENSPFGCGA